jgi:hypothetical protein
MSLTSHKKDYKTRARQAENNLKKHYALMLEYIEKGMTRDEASKKAFDDIKKL